MVDLTRIFQRIAIRVGGPRVLALPLLRTLAVLAAVIWILLVPGPFFAHRLLLWTVLAFTTYSLAVEASLWLRPGATLRLNFYILLIDGVFALALIALSGGARSALYLALPLIAALQSYYYGMRRGLIVAVVATLTYLAVIWPTLGDVETANAAIRVVVLLGTAVSVGILADVEAREGLRVAALSADARERERFIESVVESLHEGVVALDPDGRVVAWNDAMERRYGIAAGELLGKNFLDFFP